MDRPDLTGLSLSLASLRLNESEIHLKTEPDAWRRPLMRQSVPNTFVITEHSAEASLSGSSTRSG